MFEIVAGELHAKLRSSAAMCARAEAGLWGRGGAWPGFETTHRATSATRHRRCEGRRRDRRAWLRRPWAAAGPGRTTSRRTSTRQHTKPHWCEGRRRDRRAWLRRPWVAAGPGRASRRRAERSSRRGRLAGGPPPTGAPSSPARRVRPSGARNTSGATSTTGARANRPYSPPPGSGRPV